MSRGPVEITLEEFQDALGRYEKLIEGVSASKSAKPGQKTLAELDRYRYVDAPALFSSNEKGRLMQLDDVKALVEWKLKHGKFRPTLVKLVSSNDPHAVEDTVKSALDTYEEKRDASAAVDALSKLRGIGPATASLLLAVHDPENVIFFADEAFYWLCGAGQRCPIKYNAKEYKELLQASSLLSRRLKVKAIDIERVAYVLIQKTESVITTDQEPHTLEKTADLKKVAPAKRKQDHINGEAAAPRRSKRGKAA